MNIIGEQGSLSSGFPHPMSGTYIANSQTGSFSGKQSICSDLTLSVRGAVSVRL